MRKVSVALICLLCLFGDHAFAQTPTPVPVTPTFTPTATLTPTAGPTPTPTLPAALPPNDTITIAPRPQLIWMGGQYYYLFEGRPPYAMHITLWTWSPWLGPDPGMHSAGLVTLPGCEYVEYSVLSDGPVQMSYDGEGGCDMFDAPAPLTIALTYTTEFAGYAVQPCIFWSPEYNPDCVPYEYGFGWAFNIAYHLGAQTVYLPVILKDGDTRPLPLPVPAVPARTPQPAGTPTPAGTPALAPTAT